jgi:excinuclease ABC subunit B
MNENASEYVSPGHMENVIKQLEKQMTDAADNLDFETAAMLRDRIIVLRDMKASKSGKR